MDAFYGTPFYINRLFSLFDDRSPRRGFLRCLQTESEANFHLSLSSLYVFEVDSLRPALSAILYAEAETFSTRPRIICADTGKFAFPLTLYAIAPPLKFDFCLNSVRLISYLPSNQGFVLASTVR